MWVEGIGQFRAEEEWTLTYNGPWRPLDLFVEVGTNSKFSVEKKKKKTTDERYPIKELATGIHRCLHPTGVGGEGEKE